MHEHRLLERIRQRAKNSRRGVRENPAQMIRSIQDHLQRILNTRQGNVLIAEDYGVPDFTNYMSSYPDSQLAIERSIYKTIEKYEPRLQGVRVKFLDQEEDKLSLSFQIQARLVLKEHKDPVMFESLVDAGGYIKVKG